ncbi:TetR/AcrR family transcriptional regulator [Flavobacterium sp. UBA7682]|uniref:TetR/AcrR family transcriptional regulator n=1 Tax=Flavobacterium sp. UBA7682 TaxID=1946560 RepID=UPI0025BA5653|nr:TetR/AcrR family transcriptional regulator [Flavobacterium sp. UBA7682]
MERAQIIEKTATFIKRYGIKSLTLAEISIRLRIPKKALYFHFKTKDELLLACLHFMYDTLKDLLTVAQSNVENPVLKLIKTYNVTIGYLSQFHSTFYFDLRKIIHLKSVTQQHINDYKLSSIRPLIEEAKNNKLLLPDAEVEAALESYMKFVPFFFVHFKDDQAAIENHLTLFLHNYFKVDYCH